MGEGNAPAAVPSASGSAVAVACANSLLPGESCTPCDAPLNKLRGGGGELVDAGRQPQLCPPAPAPRPCVLDSILCRDIIAWEETGSDALSNGFVLSLRTLLPTMGRPVDDVPPLAVFAHLLLN